MTLTLTMAREGLYLYLRQGYALHSIKRGWQFTFDDNVLLLPYINSFAV